MRLTDCTLRAGARVRDGPPQPKQALAEAFTAARAAGAEPEWRPVGQPAADLAYYVGELMGLSWGWKRSGLGVGQQLGCG